MELFIAFTFNDVQQTSQNPRETALTQWSLQMLRELNCNGELIYQSVCSINNRTSPFKVNEH